MIFSATVGDYNFQSSGIPGGHSKDEVKQIVSFIWDDNAYSGLSKTQYETSGGGDFASSSFIDEIAPLGGAKPNCLNLTSGDIGMSWAAYKLAGIPINPDEWLESTAYAPYSKVSYNGKFIILVMIGLSKVLLCQRMLMLGVGMKLALLLQL